MANKLKAIRQSRGLAIWGLATRAHTSPTLLSAVEKHDYRPRSPLRERIAAALGVSVGEIWPGDSPTPTGEGNTDLKGTGGLPL